MQPIQKMLSGFVAVLMSVAVAPAAAGAQSIFDGQPAINDAVLGEMRGGFTTTSGLQISFGIERVLLVNGELISTTSLNVINVGSANPVVPVAPVAPDVMAGMPALDKLTSPAMSVAQTDESIAAAGSATAAGESAVANAAPPRVSSAANAGSVALIQSGAGNTVSPGTFSASAIGTVVQNTLNNQKIQNFTVISATVNSLEILKTLNLQSTLGSAINDSVRK